MQFHCDKCVTIITRKHLLNPLLPREGDKAEVSWSGETYSVTVLAKGDQKTVEEAERRFLEKLENTSDSGESKPPPSKKRRIVHAWRRGKENKKKTKVSKKTRVIKTTEKQAKSEQVKTKVCH